jgi:hypothetical protein
MTTFLIRRRFASLPRLARLVRLARLALLALLCGIAAQAQAHKPSDSYLTLNVAGSMIDGQWDIALRDLDFAMGLDQDGDGNLTWDEIRGQHAQIAAYALQRLSLATQQGACPVAVTQQLIDNHTDGAYTVLRFHAACPAEITTLDVGYRLFADLDPQHKGLVQIRRDGVVSTAIFDPDRPRQQLSLQAPDRMAQFGDYVRHGVWHIWIGFDHILFLLSLLLPAVLATARSAPSESIKASFIDVLKVVTAFTLAHSITLTLASLSVISLPSRWVESAIAVSVVAAALNNIFPLFRGKRPLAAFAFGLIHGFGFASVLTDLGLPQSALIASLLGFNVGVELGQLCIVALFLPLAYLLRRTWFYRQTLTWGSAAIALVAAVWLFERLFDMKIITA